MERMLPIKNCSIADFAQIAKKRKVYGFGVSIQLEIYSKLRSPDYSLTDMVDVLVDNDKNKIGTFFHISEKQIPIISVNEMLNSIAKGDVLIILSGRYGEIIENLDQYRELSIIDTYILNYIDDFPDSKFQLKEMDRWKEREFHIPPIIHYCWFGDKKIPERYLEYLESWKKYCPDYQIIKWDETNYDVNRHPFSHKMYSTKKWAFVSDYARLDIIYNYGGIYLDMDVELLQSMDALRRFPAYLGYESTQMVNTGLGFGAVRGHRLIKELRDAYDEVDLSEEQDTIPCTVHQTHRLRKLGLRGDNSFQMLGNDELAVLPTEFLCGIRLHTRKSQITANTISLHHWCGDWGGKEKVQKGKLLREKYDDQIIRRLAEPLEFDYR